MKITTFKLFFIATIIFFLVARLDCIDNGKDTKLTIDCMILEPEYDEVIETGTICPIKFYLNIIGEDELSRGIDSINIYIAKDIGEDSSPVDSVKIGSVQYDDNKDTYEYEWDTSGTSSGNWYIFVAIYSSAFNTDYYNTRILLTLSTLHIITSDVTEITANSAVCGGTITYTGPHNITKRGVVWSSDNESPDITNNDSITDDGSGIGTFTSHLTNLDKLSYYVRAYAVNSDGVAYGDVKNFKPDKSLPSVSIDDAGDITAHTAMAGGIITDDGGDQGNITAGFVWSETPDPTIDNNDGIYTVPEKLSKDMTFWGYLSSLKENTTYYIKPYASNIAGTAYGEELTIKTGIFQIQSGTFTDTRDGKQYRMVTIYSQTWMAENLAYLPEVCPPDGNCGYWVYGYEGTSVDEAKATDNYKKYGVLYNWYKARTACPEGWHLPTSDEWSILEMHLGMDYNSAHDTYNTYLRGNNEGGMLKESGTAHWLAPNKGANNVAGFYAVAGGQLTYNSGFFGWMHTCYFWTITTTGVGGDKKIIYRKLLYSIENISSWEKSEENKDNGYSVRCVKD